MRIAVTGATGFLGHYIVNHLASAGHVCRCWHRPGSDRGGFEAVERPIEWVAGRVGRPEGVQPASSKAAMPWSTPPSTIPVAASEAKRGRSCWSSSRRTARHAATDRGGPASRRRTVHLHFDLCRPRQDPRRPAAGRDPSDLGHQSLRRHKAAIEQFVYSYGLGEGYPICALRPTGIYGIARPVEDSKWFDLGAGREAGRNGRVSARREGSACR